MQYSNLGKSHLKVSKLCLGTMMFGDHSLPNPFNINSAA